MATKIFVGDSVKEAIAALPANFKIADIIKKLGLSRTQYYWVINQPTMRLEYVRILKDVLSPHFIIPKNKATTTESEKLLLKLAKLQEINKKLSDENNYLRNQNRSGIEASTPK